MAERTERTGGFQIEVEREAEGPRGWETVVRITHRDGSGSHHVVTLSFQDYEVWCGGASPPAAVVRALVKTALESPPAETGVPDPLPERFDGSTVRRWIRTLDESLPGRIGAGSDGGSGGDSEL